MSSGPVRMWRRCDFWIAQRRRPGAPTGWRLFNAPLYISLDLDALDPAFAPVVSHHEPGGLTTHQILEIIQEAPEHIAGADIVEYNPTHDPLDLTAILTAKLTKELIGRLLEPIYVV